MSSSRNLSCLVAALLCSAGASVLAIEESRAQEARAAYAYVTNNLNQRAGPNTRFPALGVIPSRTQVTINGCLEDLSWCEGAYGDVRGWMSATYLRLYDYTTRGWVEVDDYASATRLARYSFDLDRYWTANYRDRPFYPQRAAWLVAPTSPAVDNGVFYRELSPHGRWTQLEGRYVFMPNVREGWRPYTEGRWQYAERYGWTWVSSEPFGWATYHYGRWAYSNRLGWVWVPGTQWAPAWVAWRGSDDHLAWAPLPPDAGPGSQRGDGYDVIPAYYWQVVASASFLNPNLAEVILRNDDRDRRDYLDRAQPIGNVTVVNNTVVNNVVNIKYVEEKTRTRVVPREVVITNDDRRQQRPEAADEDVVRIYQPPVSEAPATETPPAVLPAEAAAEQSRTAGQAGDEPATEDRVAATPPPAEAAAPPTEAPPLAADEAPVAETPAAVPGEATTEPPADAPPPPAGTSPRRRPMLRRPRPPRRRPMLRRPPAVDEPAPPADAPPPPPAVDEPAPPADAPPPPPPWTSPRRRPMLRRRAPWTSPRRRPMLRRRLRPWTSPRRRPMLRRRLRPWTSCAAGRCSAAASGRGRARAAGRCSAAASGRGRACAAGRCSAAAAAPWTSLRRQPMLRRRLPPWRARAAGRCSAARPAAPADAPPPAPAAPPADAPPPPPAVEETAPPPPAAEEAAPPRDAPQAEKCGDGMPNSTRRVSACLARKNSVRANHAA